MPDGQDAGMDGQLDATPAGGVGATLHHPRLWGAEPSENGLWRFALWAPKARTVALEMDGETRDMRREEDGFWRLTRSADADAAYAFVVDGTATPDPAARAQAGADVMGPSRLLDPRAYSWRTSWAGRPWEEAVIYEMHVGTFTREGTFDAVIPRLQGLADLGITAIEIMPVPHGPGQRGWGYDGALLSAPHPAYGTPEAMKRLVEAAQGLGLMVILDVVMNHFSPEGSDIGRISPDMFDASRKTPWGDAIDFTQPAVRSFFIDLCLGWLTEYRLDGIRFDAVHEIKDPSVPEFLIDLGRRIRATDFGRPIHLITEDERNRPTFREPQADGAVLYDAEWNDDFHHAMHCALTDEQHSFLASFAVDPIADLVLALAQGYVETGQPREGHSGEPRGKPAGHLPWTAFVNHNQNHDQIGNHPGGQRLLSIADPRAVEVAHAILLTGPFIPMLFMGEEEGERTPFHYFCDVSPALGLLVQEGRKREFAGMDGGNSEFPDPNDPATLDESRPFADSGTDHARHWRDLTRRLLTLRHERIVPLLKSGRAGPATVHRRGSHALSATWPFNDGVVVMHANLGAAADLPPMTEPHDFALFDIAHDPYAFALIVSGA